MNTAVHGKGSLAEALLADGSSAGKGAHENRDKTNTVDFGATLASLIDQTAVGKDLIHSNQATSSAPPVRGKHSADASVAFDSNAKDAPTTLKRSADAPVAFDSNAKDASTILKRSADAPVAFDSGAEDAPTLKRSADARWLSTRTLRMRQQFSNAALMRGGFRLGRQDASTILKRSADAPAALDMSTTEVDGRFSKVATTPKPGSESRAHAPTQEVISHTSSARSDSFAALSDDHTFAIRRGEVAAAESSLHQTNTSASDGVVSTSRTSADGANASRTSDGVTAGERTGQSAAPALVVQSGVAAVVDSPVPDADIALDPKSQASSAKADHDPGPALSAQVASAARDPANVANPAQINADADVQITARPRTNDSAHSHISRANSGTSPALSTQGANSDSMNPADSKITQPTLANRAADATASSAQQSSQKQTGRGRAGSTAGAARPQR